MKKLALLATLVLIMAPAFASDDALYTRLSAVATPGSGFVPQRTETGIDFISAQKIGGPATHGHPKYHVEIEGALPAAGINSLPAAAEAVAALLASEVDQTEAQKNPILPGVNVDFVDVNGVIVAILSYRAKGEDQPYRKRAVLYVPGGIYTATMSLHSESANDPAGLFLMMLVVEMVKSGEIIGLGPNHSFKPTPLRGAA